MSVAAARVHDVLLPQPAGGTGLGAAMAVVVHAGLVLALTVSVDWRAHEPETVAAELWAAVPEAAAPQAEPVPEPAPVPPPPPVAAPAPAPPPVAQPSEADIAIERAERKKAEDERKRAEAAAEALRKRELAEADRKKREQAEADARELREQRAEEDRLARQREENLRRMMGQAGGAATGTGGSGTAAREAAPSADYAGRIKAAIRRNIVFTGAAEIQATTEVEVRTAPAGTILSARITKPSGHKDWDEAVMRGLDKTGKLPPDTDGRVPPTLTLVFRPRE